MPRHLMYVLLVVIAVDVALPLGPSEAVGVKRVLTQMPVEGHLMHGGTFAGRLTVDPARGAAGILDGVGGGDRSGRGGGGGSVRGTPPRGVEGRAR